MATVHRLPTRTEVFSDVRSGERALRVTQHEDEGVLVLSVWQGGICTASFRLAMADAARLISLLATSLGDQLADTDQAPLDQVREAVTRIG